LDKNRDDQNEKKSNMYKYNRYVFTDCISIIGMFLLTSISSFSTGAVVTTKSTNEIIDKRNDRQIGTLSTGAEVPTWSKGNYWIYDFQFDFEYEGLFSLKGMGQNKGIQDMRVEVSYINENTGEYTLDITGDLCVDLEIFGIGFGTYTADADGEAHVDIATLALKDVSFSLTGNYKLLQNWPTDITLDFIFDPAFNFFDFPIIPGENPWNGGFFCGLDGHINIHGLYETDFIAEGFVNDEETISYVKQETITVPGGSFDCFMFSGSLGPSSNGWSKLWYSPEAKYLVKVDEKISSEEFGVEARMLLTLQATNCANSAIVDVTVHRIKMIDPIEFWPGDQADWSYRLSAFNGNDWIDIFNDDYSDGDDDHIEDVVHQFAVHEITKPLFTIKVWDRDDIWPDGPDLADVGSREGWGVDNSIPDRDGAIFHCKYDIVKDELVDNDVVTESDGYYVTCGEYDNNIGGEPDDGNDAKVWFEITDDYDPPKKPKTPKGPNKVEEGIEYEYTTTAVNSNENQLFYMWNWGDNTYSKWLGPYNSDETIKASHTWADRGTYEIKIKTKDVYDIESEWSDPLPIEVPKQFPRLNNIKLKIIQLLQQFFNQPFIENFTQLINQ